MQLSVHIDSIFHNGISVKKKKIKKKLLIVNLNTAICFSGIAILTLLDQISTVVAVTLLLLEVTHIYLYGKSA